MCKLSVCQIERKSYICPWACMQTEVSNDMETRRNVQKTVWTFGIEPQSPCRDRKQLFTASLANRLRIAISFIRHYWYASMESPDPQSHTNTHTLHGSMSLAAEDSGIRSEALKHLRQNRLAQWKQRGGERAGWGNEPILNMETFLLTSSPVLHLTHWNEPD